MTQARNVALNGSQINSSGVMLTPGGGTNTATPGAVGNLLTSDGTNWVSQAPAASGVTSFNTRTGAVTLASGDVTGALGYTPVQPNGTGASGTWGINISGSSATVGSIAGNTLSSGQVTTALGYTPPQPNGTGASGTWGISVSGNAATASNGGVTSVNGSTGAVTVSGGASSYNGVGSVAFARNGATLNPAPGSSYSGANLAYGAITDNGGAGGLIASVFGLIGVGTWQATGATDGAGAGFSYTTYLRIA